MIFAAATTSRNAPAAAAVSGATAVGDDRIQQRSRGYVVPESFTHGSSAQRVRWFNAGLQSGDLRQCNTFGARDL
jgi:predicted metalloprotease